MSGYQSETRKVVVKFKPEMLKNESKGFNAARIRELGLTSYGNTVDGALGGLERLFHRFVARHRAQGTLEKVLSRSTTEWYWEDEYDGDTPYKDVTPGRPDKQTDTEQRQDQWADLVPSPLGLAA